MAVQEGPSFKRYAANGIATVYSIPFLLLSGEDLVVTLDGVEITSGITLAGIGNPTSTATFDVAPSGDLLFLLMVPFQRLNDYQENGDLLSLTLNNDLDRIWLAIKELRRDDQRALSVDPLEPEGIPALPVAALRQSRVLAFDALGNPVPSNLTLPQLEEQPALALASAQAAESAANTAVAAADAAVDSKDAAQASELKAYKWADEAEDVLVEPGKFSAKHWAAKAMAALAGLVARVTALEGLFRPFTKEFVSAEQTITAGGQLTIAHGLSVKPKTVQAYLVVKTAFSNWAVNDEMFIELDYEQSNASPVIFGYTCKREISNLVVRFGNSGILLHDATTASYVSPATVAANCKIIFEAWA